jgi:competence protein ComEC
MPHETDNCIVKDRYAYAFIPDCEQFKPARYLRVIGRPDPASDEPLFSRKRLIISDIHPLDAQEFSINHWPLQIKHLQISLQGVAARSLLNAVRQPEGGLLVALLLGDRSWLYPSIEPLFKNTGTLHVLATSGMHLTIVMDFFRSLFPKAVPFSIKVWVLSVATLIYFFLVGPQPSMVRAVGMAFHSLITRDVLFKQYQPVHSLIIVTLMILIIRPEWLFSPGLQLSVLATLGILIIHPLLPLLTRELKSYVKSTDSKFSLIIINIISHYMVNPFLASIAAQICITPVVLYHFGSLPLLGAVSSTAVSWYIPFLTRFGVMMLVMLMLTSLMVLAPLRVIMGEMAWWLAHFLLTLMRLLGSYSWGDVSVS